MTTAEEEVQLPQDSLASLEVLEWEAAVPKPFILLLDLAVEPSLLI